MEKLEKAFEKNNLVLLTGPGGTGKTYNINKFCEGKNAARTATTGIAATHIKGQTIHSFSGMKNHFGVGIVPLITGSYFFSEIQYEIYNAQVVVIDEVSMLHRVQFDMLDRIFQKACFSNKPFGGKKVLFSGDFLQLPPVDKTRSEESAWAFNSKVWQDYKPEVIELTKIWRQEDVNFTETLMRIRNGECSDSDNEMILSRQNYQFKDVEPVRFMATNKEVDGWNKYKLNQIPGKVYEYDADIKVHIKCSSEKHEKMIRDNLIREAVAQEHLELKIGCQVMILKNGSNYCNGTMGTLVKASSDSVVVHTFDGHDVTLERADWEKLNISNQKIATFTQIPVKPAYAITVHKSQGMTLDYCDIDFKSVFAPGQAYVALSRVKSLDGLRVTNWNRKCVFADKEALNFYERVRK